MSASYVMVQWTPPKWVYDRWLLIGVAVYLGVFIAIGALLFAGEHAISPPILVMRALGSCALILLHVILIAGPLSRLDRRFLPLLYNRRHMGVTMFVVAALHGLIATGFYHGFGGLHPLVSLLIRGGFQLSGAVALGIFFLLAVTSHDFWQKTLTPGVWKGLHMLVYLAYALVILHVAFGAMQTERAVPYALLLVPSVLLVAGLHLLTGVLEVSRDWRRSTEEWIDAGPLTGIEDQSARTVVAADGTRIAVFRDGDSVHGFSNVCAHQGGPLGEGKIIDGCVTCPWHGWQYRAESGVSPPPFDERVPVYPTRIEDGRVYVRAAGLGETSDA